MKKSKSKRRIDFKPPESCTQGNDPDLLGATASTTTVYYINRPHTAVIGQTNIISDGSITGGTHESSPGLRKNDLLVALLNDIFEHNHEPETPLYDLEQELCKKLREATKTNVPAFQDYNGFTFKQFLERNPSHFSMTSRKDSVIVVSKTKRKKKKKRKGKGALEPVTVEPETRALRSRFGSEMSQGLGNTDESTSSESISPSQSLDTSQWQGVSKKRTPKKHLNPTSEDSAAQNPYEADISASSPPVVDAFVENLLKRPPDDTVILRRSEDVYMHDRLEFTLDVSSLWNTPYHNKKYIILGIQPRPQPRHVLVGLRSPIKEEVIQSLLQKDLFKIPPMFTYREILTANKLVGVVEIGSSHGCGFPSIICTDDVAPKLKKDELWARKDGKNVLVAASDLFSGQIHAWFQFPRSPEQPVSNPLPSNRNFSSVLEQHQTARSDLVAPHDMMFKDSVHAHAENDTGSDQSHKLIKALMSFQKGHFVLVCGSMRITWENIEPLSAAPWIAVYDFDFRGRDSGLLAYLEDSIKKRRALSVFTWCDPLTGLTEKGTQWWSLRGQRAIPDSSVASESSHVQWSMIVREKLEKLCSELARFCETYTVLTILVLWPNSAVEVKCIQKFINKLQEHVQPKIILCFTDPDSNASDSQEVNAIQSFSEDADSVQVFRIGLGELCAQLAELQTNTPPSLYQYQLRTVDSKSINISDVDVAWLSQDLDVLYLQSPYTKTNLNIKEESDGFFRGGTINWYVWYDVGSNCLDVERSISKDVVKHIRDEYLKNFRNGMVTLFHAPGAGGSTMAQRVLWDLHEETPCVQVKLRSGSSMEDLAAKLLFVLDRTHLPVVALIDGEDEPRLKQLSMYLQRHYVVILCVKRRPDKPPRFKPTESKFYLAGTVDKRESRNLVHKFRESCEEKQHKIAALNKLDDDVQSDRVIHQMYEYGMTVFDHEFQGVRSFVRGYLQVEQCKGRELSYFQKCLGFLALVYYYGQSSLPCQFFASLLGKPPSYILDLEDFPHNVRVFLVPDQNEGRRGYIRIGHYIVAKEILEQILNRNVCRIMNKFGASDRLSKHATRNLKAFCIEFIGQTAKKKTKTSVMSPTITHILTKTFIFRDYKDVGDIQTQTKRKTQFSQIMSDLDSEPPYNGRLEVLQKLCEVFPEDPSFRAHIGRFYTCCRPEDEDQAEKHFKAALKLCEDQSAGKEPHELDEGSKLTRMHVYHMYGMFFQRRIARYIGWSPDDTPFVATDQSTFQERFDEIVHNAEEACRCFVLCRQNTPPGLEDCYTYINDIHVRLQTCEFVNRYFHGGVRSYLAQRASGTNFAFIKNSVAEIEDLIMECYYVILLDNVVLLQKYVIWYSNLFNKCSKELEALAIDDDFTSLRLKFLAKKLQFRRQYNIVSVEGPIPPEEIKSLVSMLESIFQNANAYDGTQKSKLELDYKDWILAIRNPSLAEVYSLEKVLEHVRHWCDSFRSPQSTFYLFILLSLLGFGSSTCPGNTDSLVEAQLLLEDMQKLSKVVVRPRCPRELLGREDFKGIRRLVSSNTVGHIDERNIPGPARSKLAVCKGTIRAKNKKLAGYIDLDLGENTVPVKVFYVPVKAKLEGSRYEGERVQFHLAFTLEHGYEAYDVTLIERYRCNGCRLKVELKWDQEMAICKCGAKVTKNEHTQVVPAPPEDDEQP